MRKSTANAQETPWLAHYFDMHPGGCYFRAILANRNLKELREPWLRELSDRIAAVGFTVVALRLISQAPPRPGDPERSVR